MKEGRDEGREEGRGEEGREGGRKGVRRKGWRKEGEEEGRGRYALVGPSRARAPSSPLMLLGPRHSIVVGARVRLWVVGRCCVHSRLWAVGHRCVHSHSWAVVGHCACAWVVGGRCAHLWLWAAVGRCACKCSWVVGCGRSLQCPPNSCRIRWIPEE